MTGHYRARNTGASKVFTPAMASVHNATEHLYEFEALFGLYCDLELPTLTAYQDDPKVEKVERWRDARQEVQEKSGPEFQARTPPPLYPHESSERKINAFSGTETGTPLGEGLLNFCYGDFNSAFEHRTPAHQKFTQDVYAKICSAEEGIICLYERATRCFLRGGRRVPPGLVLNGTLACSHEVWYTGAR